MPKADRRFVWTVEEHGFFKGLGIIVDTQTGVNYLFVQSGNGGGLTALLDENGKPVVTKNIVMD